VRFNHRIRTDSLFIRNLEVYPKTTKFVAFLSTIVSFQFFRLIRSNFCGSMRFNAGFEKEDHGLKFLNNLSVPLISTSYFLAILSNAYNLFWTPPQRQLFYHDLESLFLTLILSILIIFDTKKSRKTDYKKGRSHH
jgi:hypothetical protein